MTNLERVKRWQKRNPDKAKNIRLKCRYGITLDQFAQKAVEQESKCGICKNIFPLSLLCVDHDHKTGKVRDLLCRSCNTIIGMAKDNPEILRLAISYLSRSTREDGDSDES